MILYARPIINFKPYANWSISPSDSPTGFPHGGHLFFASVTAVALVVLTALGAAGTLPIGMTGVKICAALTFLPFIYGAFVVKSFCCPKRTSKEKFDEAWVRLAKSNLNLEAEKCGQLYQTYLEHFTIDQAEEAAIRLYRQTFIVQKIISGFPVIKQTNASVAGYFKAMVDLQHALLYRHLTALFPILLDILLSNGEEKEVMRAQQEPLEVTQSLKELKSATKKCRLLYNNYNKCSEPTEKGEAVQQLYQQTDLIMKIISRFPSFEKEACTSNHIAVYTHALMVLRSNLEKNHLDLLFELIDKNIKLDTETILALRATAIKELPPKKAVFPTDHSSEPIEEEMGNNELWIPNAEEIALLAQYTPSQANSSKGKGNKRPRQLFNSAGN